MKYLRMTLAAGSAVFIAGYLTPQFFPYTLIVLVGSGLVLGVVAAEADDTY